MLKIHTLALGDYQTNCYILCDAASTGCCIIDPGYEADVILKKVAELGLNVEAVLLTHGHFDHVGAVEEIVTRTGCPLWMHKGDWALANTPLTGYFYPLANCDFTDVHFCAEGDKLHIAGMDFLCLETPGHTPGSMCFLCENALFSGDTLFWGACGRTDLPGGDAGALRLSLRRLAGLEGDYRVYPGHGNSTTLSAEKRYNPYMN